MTDELDCVASVTGSRMHWSMGNFVRGLGALGAKHALRAPLRLRFGKRQKVFFHGDRCGLASPADPNGPIFWNGQYHMLY